VELLNLEFGFSEIDSIASLLGSSEAGFKRWVKENIYFRLPSGLRAFSYFFYRYFIRLGFLDGRSGADFHFLQAFWYRYLVDAKVAEVRREMHRSGRDVKQAIYSVLGVKL
jgi:hypothetical protein